MAHGTRSVDDPAMIPETSMRKLLLLAAAAAAGVAVLLKVQRERDLDEAVWEEPQDI